MLANFWKITSVLFTPPPPPSRKGQAMVEFTIAIIAFAALLTGALYLGSLGIAREKVQRDATEAALRQSLLGSASASGFTGEDIDFVPIQQRVVPRMAPGNDWTVYDDADYAADFGTLLGTFPAAALGLVSAEHETEFTPDDPDLAKAAQAFLGIPSSRSVRWKAWATKLGGLYNSDKL